MTDKKDFWEWLKNNYPKEYKTTYGYPLPNKHKVARKYVRAYIEYLHNNRILVKDISFNDVPNVRRGNTTRRNKKHLPFLTT